MMWTGRIAIGIILAILATVGIASPAAANRRGDPIQGDFNADGLTDIAFLGVIAPNYCSVTVTYGRPSGVFLPPVAFAYLNPALDPINACPDIGTSFDWDGDPGDELWIGWTTGTQPGLDFNRMALDNTDFHPIETSLTPITPILMGTADFTGDGRATGYSYGAGGFSSYIRADHSGVVLGPEEWCSVGPPLLTLRDFNRNNAVDALLSYTQGCDDNGNGVVVVLDDGTVRQLELDTTRTHTWTTQVVFADGDRFPDVRTTDSTGDIDYFIGTGTGDFTPSPRSTSDAVYPTNSNKILIDVLANDHATSGARLSIATPPAHGRVQVLSDRRIAYTPTGTVQTDRFVYQLTEEGRTSRAPVFIRPRL
nr:hypothetical protein [Micromonospora sp. DSM 115978]